MLAVLVTAFPGECWTLRDLAELTGLSDEAIRLIERRAFRKLIRLLEKQGICRQTDVQLGRGWSVPFVARRGRQAPARYHGIDQGEIATPEQQGGALEGAEGGDPFRQKGIFFPSESGQGPKKGTLFL